jgi:hypothetical protein
VTQVAPVVRIETEVRIAAVTQGRRRHPARWNRIPGQPDGNEFSRLRDAAEQEAEAARLVSLGASRVDWDKFPEDPDFIVLADTEGNRFCIVDL